MMKPDYTTASEQQLDFALSAQELRGQVIAVTGATGGLGSCVCKALGEAGATVVLLGRQLKKLEALYDQLTATGAATPAMLTLDLNQADEADCKSIAESLFSEFGRIDALVHCAAELGTSTPHTEIRAAQWSQLMMVNLSAARWLTLACLPLLARSEKASVVFLLDDKPGAYWGSYGITKTALHAFMHMLAEEHEGRRDRHGNPLLAINGYDPGPLRTPLRRKAFPGELEREAPLPQTRLGPLLALITRQSPGLTGAALCYPHSPDTTLEN